MKQILTFLMIFVLMASVVLAAPPENPNPIIGYLTLNGVPLTGYIIDVTNVRTGATVSGDTISSLITDPNSGGFFVRLSKIGFIAFSEVYVGDTVKVSVRGFSDPQATVSFIPLETPFYFDLAIVNQQDAVQCSDGSFVVNKADCPVPPPPPPPPPPSEDLEDETKVSTSDDRETATMEAFFGQVMNGKIGDNKLSGLIDKEISYDSEKYDVKEEVLFKGVVLTSIDDEDFGREPYLTFGEEDLVYKYIFKDEIPYLDFHLEEPLEITFLGRDLKIIEASTSEMVIRTGEEFFLTEGDEVEVEGKKVLVKTIGDGSVAISVDGTEEIVSDGNDREINGLHVLVENILYKDYQGGESRVELVIGLETDETVKDGEDFELFVKDEELWTWVIKLGDDIQYIGVMNQESYKDIDEDEEYKAVGVGESFYFPNNFIAVTFSSVTEEDMTKLNFKVKEKDGSDYLYVKGDSEDAFVFGSSDYEKLYINELGIYDDDLELITTDKVTIGDSDTSLELGSVKIRDLTILLDMADILFKAVSYAGRDEVYMDHFGIVFEDPENAVEDQEGFKVTVPEARLEVLISFGMNVPVVMPEEADEEEEEETDVVVPTDTIVPPVVPPIVEPPVPPITPPVTPPVVPPVEPPVEPESDLKTILITMIASIIGIFAWGKGFAALIKYYLRKAEETSGEEAKKYRARAEKMAKTVVFNFLAGKYKK